MDKRLHVIIPSEDPNMKLVVDVHDQLQVPGQEIFVGTWEDPEHPDPFLLIHNLDDNTWYLSDERSAKVVGPPNKLYTVSIMEVSPDNRAIGVRDAFINEDQMGRLKKVLDEFEDESIREMESKIHNIFKNVEVS